VARLPTTEPGYSCERPAGVTGGLLFYLADQFAIDMDIEANCTGGSQLSLTSVAAIDTAVSHDTPSFTTATLFYPSGAVWLCCGENQPRIRPDALDARERLHEARWRAA
jgi:hypothetical protein